MISRPGSSILMILLACHLSSCGHSDLSRQEAARLLEASTLLGEYKLNLLMHENAERLGVSLSWWQIQGGAVVNMSQAIRSEGSAVKRSMFGFGKTYMVLNKPAEISISVTGITGDKNRTARTVEFNWHYKMLSPLSRRIAVQGGTGEAVFQRYDDGWRIVELISMTLSNSPYSLTDQEKQELEKEIALERSRREAAEKVAMEERRAFGERLRLAQTPTKVLRQFDLEKKTGLGSVLTSIKVTDAGVEISQREKMMSKWYEKGNKRYLFGQMYKKYDPAMRDQNGYLDFGGNSTGLYFQDFNEAKEVIFAVNQAFLNWRTVYSDVLDKCWQQSNTWACEPPRETTKPRVTAHQIVIPPHGVVRVGRGMRCNADNISNEDMRGIKRMDEQNAVVYISSLDREVHAKVWFFDEGGVCTNDVHKLVAERAFM